MIYGISGKSIPSNLPYAGPISQVCSANNFPPSLAYAVAQNETIDEYGDTAATRLQDGYTTDPGYDGTCGHGLFQLTSSGPPNWSDPLANAQWAITKSGFLMDAMNYWYNKYGLTGEALVKATAASFNAGIGGAEQGHLEHNDVDYFTTNHYGERALQHYRELIAAPTVLAQRS